MTNHRALIASLIIAMGMTCGCEEGPAPDIEAPDTPTPAGDLTRGEPEPMRCDQESPFLPGQTLPRRLTAYELRNTVYDLTGVEVPFTINFPQEETSLGFDNNARALQVTPLHAERFMEAAEFIAQEMVARIDDFVPCINGIIAEDCVAQFIDDFGSRAWRRPLSDTDAERLIALYEIGAGNGGEEVESGLSLVIEAILQSPLFLYRTEVGEPVAGETDLRRLTPYELASRLSYFVWRTMPDDELFSAAAEDRLSTDEEIALQLDRMLLNPRARNAFWTFFVQWLHLKEVKSMVRDPRYYPLFNEEDAEQMYDDARAFVEESIWSEGGSVVDLFEAPFFVEGDPTGVQRRGILSLPALLAATSKPNMTSPIHRGVFVREQLLCTALPPPPPDAMVVAPDPDPTLTTREIFEVHTADAACAGCHSLIDPIGLGFEHFDAVGQWRDQENGHPVDARGELIGTTDINGEFYGVEELSVILAGSSQVHECVTTQVFRFAMGRGESAADGCYLDDVNRAYVDSGYDFKTLVRRLASHKAFRYRMVEAE